MPVTIKHLNCRVRVQTGGAHASPHAPEAVAQPTLEYAQSTTGVQGTTAPPTSEMATEQRGQGGEHEPQPAGRVEPSKVADRVYELLIEEARIARLRGGG